MMCFARTTVEVAKRRQWLEQGGPGMKLSSATHTMAGWVQLLRPGRETHAHRQTSSAIYHIFAGQGCGVIAG
jgi:gentisate 1,2-dioxygenase